MFWMRGALSKGRGVGRGSLGSVNEEDMISWWEWMKGNSCLQKIFFFWVFAPCLWSSLLSLEPLGGVGPKNRITKFGAGVLLHTQYKKTVSLGRQIVSITKYQVTNLPNHRTSPGNNNIMEDDSNTKPTLMSQLRAKFEQNKVKSENS